MLTMQPLNKLLWQMRKTSAITQEELAKRLGITKSNVSQWENGATITFERAAEIAQVMGFEITLGYRPTAQQP